MSKKQPDPSTKPAHKKALKKAALSQWIYKLHQSADKACGATGGYECLTREFPQANTTYWTIIGKLRDLAEELDKIAENPLLMKVNVNSGCEDDSQCPDDYICVGGNCESPFPPN